ncbi:MAG: hypothetical protein PF961_14075 [Planctomycetota bacterium]|jgi:hypothetical protein|nr:hypothetical protein [Planctomycetota bacterium]
MLSKTRLMTPAVLTLALALTGCGGSGGGDPAPASPTGSTPAGSTPATGNQLSVPTTFDPASASNNLSATILGYGTPVVTPVAPGISTPPDASFDGPVGAGDTLVWQEDWNLTVGEVYQVGSTLISETHSIGAIDTLATWRLDTLRDYGSGTDSTTAHYTVHDGWIWVNYTNNNANWVIDFPATLGGDDWWVTFDGLYRSTWVVEGVGVTAPSGHAGCYHVTLSEEKDQGTDDWQVVFESSIYIKPGIGAVYRNSVEDASASGQGIEESVSEYIGRAVDD